MRSLALPFIIVQACTLVRLQLVISLIDVLTMRVQDNLITFIAPQNGKIPRIMRLRMLLRG